MNYGSDGSMIVEETNATSTTCDSSGDQSSAVCSVADAFMQARLFGTDTDMQMAMSSMLMLIQLPILM